MKHVEDREAALDALLRPQLVLDPPPEVQDRILASALRTADELSAARAPSYPAVRPELAGGLARSPSLAMYGLLAVVVALYAGLVGAFGSGDWPLLLVQQVAPLLTGALRSPATWLAAALADQLAGQAVWLALLPVAWLLWESDHAPAAQR